MTYAESENYGRNYDVPTGTMLGRVWDQLEIVRNHYEMTVAEHGYSHPETVAARAEWHKWSGVAKGFMLALQTITPKN